MLPEDRPTIPERYSRAMQSSHLETNNDGGGDLDLLIAAGWVKRESLGTSLYRLRTEFDAINALELARAKNSLVARWLTMMQLRSLPETKVALGRYTIKLATIKRFMRTDGVALAIAGRVLDAWLDPLCPTCDGRGFTGGYGAPIVLCTACHGSGKRGVQFDKANDGHEFGRTLMSNVERKVDFVRTEMRRYLRTHP